MKKIINGKLYDTSTAKVIVTDCGYNVRSFDYYEEELYRKRTGEFFLHGVGGPLTRYAEPVGNFGSRSGERIIPLTDDEAREYLERFTDVYIATFGEPEE